MTEVKQERQSQDPELPPAKRQKVKEEQDAAAAAGSKASDASTKPVQLPPMATASGGVPAAPVKTEQALGAGGAASSSSGATKQKQVKQQQEGGASSSTAGAGGAEAKGEIEVAEENGEGGDGTTNWEAKKLDDQRRIMKSVTLLNATVQEDKAALYWICEAKTLKKVASCIGQICKEVNIKVCKDALVIAGVDQGRSCVCECKLTRGAFTRFHTRVDKFQLGIDLNTFLRVLSPFKEQDMVVFCLNDETDDVIRVQGFHTYKRNNEFAFMKIRLMTENLAVAIGGLGVELENNDLWSILEMSASEFTEIFKDLKELSGKSVEVSYTPDGKFELKLPEDTAAVSGSTVLQEGGSLRMLTKPKSEVKMTVNADYIAKFGPHGSQISDKVKIYAANGMPFVCQFQDEKLTNCANFYLIPRV
eukprot:g6639.t1